jgi:hypothetical protein
MANRFFPNVGKLYATKVMPVILDVNMTVSSTDTAGFGVTNVTGPGIAAVYMHTTATPATGSPNPAAGYIMIKLADNYNGLAGIDHMISSPNSGTGINISSGLTIGQAYVITSVGTSTAANFQAVGLPVGLTPTVGQAFIATSSSAGTGTGVVQVPKATGSGTNHIEVVGLPNTELAPIGLAQGVNGGFIILQCLAATNSSTTTLVATAPADGSAISIKLYLSNSSVTAGAAGQ